MALKSFLSLTDSKLAEAFSFVPPDPMKARKPFLTALDKAAKQFEEGKQPRGDSALWSANNNIVRFTPKVGGVPVMIEGESEFHIPAERFPNALKELRASVEAGELDDALSTDVAKNPMRAAAAQRTVKRERAGWSEERRQRHAATIAARKAAQGR